MKFGGWLEKLGGKSGSKGPSNVPPTLGAPQRSPFGPFQFKISLSRACPYEIRASSDLHHWIPIASHTASDNSFEYLDSDAPKYSHRFYRVFADGVPSANVIGYAAITLPPGLAMVANPFQAPDNSVGALFPNWPDGTTLNKFDTSLFRLADNGVTDQAWTNPQDQFVPGEGAIFFNPTPDYRPLVFVGNVIQEDLSIPIPVGFSVSSSPVPLHGLLHEELGFPIGEGDVVHLFDREKKKYLLYPYEDGKWTSGSPSVSIGESFWIAKKTAANWVRTLTIAA